MEIFSFSSNFEQGRHMLMCKGEVSQGPNLDNHKDS